MRLFRFVKRPGRLQMAAKARIDQTLHTAQLCTSRYINAKTAGWTRRQQMIFLLLVSLFFAGGSGWILYSTLSSKQPVSRGSLPNKIVTVPLRKVEATESHLTAVDTAAILSLREKIDSLTRTPAGRTMLSQRPGLLDSLRLAEELLDH